jgi:hypothetical protein
MVHAPVDERTRFRPSRALLRRPSRGENFVAPSLRELLGRSNALNPSSFQHLDRGPMWYRPLDSGYLTAKCIRPGDADRWRTRAEILTLPIQTKQGMRALLTAKLMNSTELMYISMPQYNLLPDSPTLIVVRDLLVH